MAHEVETMFSGSSQTPWHELGEVIEGTATSAEALKLSGLDWRVRLERVMVANPEWRRDDQVIDDAAIVRETDGRVYGIVSPSYVPLQNDELFAVGDALRENGARWETAGSLQLGKRVWALMRLADDDGGDDVAGGDIVRSYLLLGNSHSGHRTADIALTSVRVVCANTYRMATLGNSMMLRFRHDADLQHNLAAAGKVLEAAASQRQTFIDASRKLVATPLAYDEQLRFLREQLAIPEEPKGQLARKLEVATDMLRWEREHSPEANSAWTAFNAVTHFTTHNEGRQEADARLASIVDGPRDAVNQRAFAAALALAS